MKKLFERHFVTFCSAMVTKHGVNLQPSENIARDRKMQPGIVDAREMERDKDEERHRKLQLRGWEGHVTQLPHRSTAWSRPPPGGFHLARHEMTHSRCMVLFSDVVPSSRNGPATSSGPSPSPCKLLRLDPAEKARLIALAFQQA